MKLLDLFCGAGLAAWGYWRSGRFSEIVGVDITDMPYPFDFIVRDALTLDYEFLDQFDFIHASPPCQAYSKVTPDKSIHPRLIAPTRLMLAATGKPHVVENVEGSGAELKPNLVLTGNDVCLPILRRRYFYCSFMISPPRVKVSSAAHSQMIGERASNVRVHGGHVRKDDLVKAMGLDEMSSSYLAKISIKHIKQGIPPAMTKAIAEAYTPHKFLIGKSGVR